MLIPPGLQQQWTNVKKTIKFAYASLNHLEPRERERQPKQYDTFVGWVPLEDFGRGRELVRSWLPSYRRPHRLFRAALLERTSSSLNG